MAIHNITKKQFEEVYHKFLPSKFEIFYIKNISVGSLSSKFWPALISSIGLLLPFIFTLLIKTLELPHCILRITSIIYVCVLALIGVYSFIIWFKKRKRLLNICKALNITRDEYEELVEKYYYENYYPSIKDYITRFTKDKEE